MGRVLLHCCCAVCMGYPYEKLLNYGVTPFVYFFNPNIAPDEEYRRRRDELVNYCEKQGIEYFVEEGSHLEWIDYIKDHVKDYENEPEKGKRCEKCFEYRLKKAAQKAIDEGIEEFCTSLTVSPHKDSSTIIQTGERIAEEHTGTQGTRLTFLKENFKKNSGFLKTSQIANTNGFYRQTYCGCEFSYRK